MRARFLAALPIIPLLLLLPALAQAQLYRWVDDTGKVHYSDQVPAPGAKNVQKQSRATGQGTAALPYVLQQAVKNYPVTLYTSDTCKDTCARARELLNKRGVPYSEVSVKDEMEIAQLKQLSGDTIVPVMSVGREVYKGFEGGYYSAALDTAGYPASSLLPPGVQARQLVAKPAPKPAPAPAAAPGEAEGRPAAAPQETAEPGATK
jgi:glutaredoxin